MLDYDSQLASRRNGCHVLTPPSSDAQKEGPQRSWRSCGRPGSLYQHATGMASALLGDPPMVGRSGARLPDAGVYAEVADQLLRTVEASNISDSRCHGERHHHVDARDCHQPLDTLVSKC